MEIIKKSLKNLLPADYNPRKITDKNLERLKESIDHFGYLEIVVWNKRTGNIISGHQRVKALQEKGVEEIEVMVVDFDEDKEKACNIAMNNPNLQGEWEEEKLAELLKELEEKEMSDLTGFEDKEISQLLDTLKEVGEDKIKISDRFIIPPFSILDTRQGYWQDRKREWVSLGLDSELGRDGNNVTAIRTKDWVNEKLGYGSNCCGNMSGVSIFDPVLCELMYKWFCIDKGKILDPYSGGSVRGIIANYLDYQYTGIDLSEKQIQANIKQGKEILPEKPPKYIIGDSLQELDKLTEKIDFIFSCPPYFDLEIYSDNPKDLSNMSWKEFKESYKQIIKKSVELLESDRFACFVVGNVRDKKGFYRDLVGLTIENFEREGMKYYNEMILIQIAGSLPIRITKQFSVSRKIGKVHQNVLVFYKGDPKKIRDNFKDIKKEIIE